MSARRQSWWIPLFVLALTLTSLPAPAASAATVEPGRLLAYIDRDRTLWIGDDQGGWRQQLTSGVAVTGAVWSGDGDRLAYTFLRDGRSVVALARFLPEPTTRELGPGMHPAWSWDGRWLAYVNEGSVQVVNRDGEPAGQYQLGATSLVWSPDGRYLGFTRPAGVPDYTDCPVLELGWVDLASGQTRIAARSFGTFAWAGDSVRLLYASAADATVWSYNVQSGAARRIANRFPNPCSGPFQITPDGQRLLFLDFRGGGDDLVVLDLNSLQERVFADLPIGYPSKTLPRSYVWVDPLGRFAYVARSYPTMVTRVDLGSGERTVLVPDDYRMLLAVSPDGSRLAFLDTPSGKPPEVVVRDLRTGETASLQRAGWAAWQPSAISPVVARAWTAVWDREDRPVAAGAVARTWIWGPEPFLTLEEPYADAAGGRRAVRYWDKSRMEVNQPSGDRSSRWFVTNGLLVRELITGQLQVGDDQFLNREPANIPVAGDLDDRSGPTYATLRSLLNAPAAQVGVEIRARVHRDGSIAEDGPGGVFAAYYVPETNHTIADVFWQYLQEESIVWDGANFVPGRLFEPTFFATGFPITEAYWARVKVGGQEKDVLIQCFERRCLTYTPDNPPGWKVEMGNVGRHYVLWRYGG
ncbi:Protein TolB [bacterium HR26]|nr:Protein TolB [bacterium HR26]